MSEPVTENNRMEVEAPSLKRPLEDGDAANRSENPKKPRMKKKKVSMLMSYCGQGYFGMQINHGFKTIEGDLFLAFQKLGIMDEESFKYAQMIGFQRAARTDKGVSATRQVVSLRMCLPEGEDMVSQICAQLPECIRVFAIKKTTNGFNSKIACDGRTYAYVLPTFAFGSVETIITKEFRITPEVISEVNQVLGYFKGTKNFHNFTSRRLPTDPSCNRYITEFICGEPFLISEMEFVKITVKGQSFMLHQIRKMVGFAIAIMRGLATKETLESTFKLDRVDIPIAPSLNLLLEEPHYDTYNKKYGNDGFHDPLCWDEYEKEIEKFSLDHILPVIYKGEIEENSMMNWLATLALHTFSVRDPDDPIVRSQTRSEFGRAAVAVELANAAADKSPEKLNSVQTESANKINEDSKESGPTDGLNDSKNDCDS